MVLMWYMHNNAFISHHRYSMLVMFINLLTVSYQHRGPPASRLLCRYDGLLWYSLFFKNAGTHNPILSSRDIAILKKLYTDKLANWKINLNEFRRNKHPGFYDDKYGMVYDKHIRKSKNLKIKRMSRDQSCWSLVSSLFVSRD